jgi:hypothetical protein
MMEGGKKQGGTWWFAVAGISRGIIIEVAPVAAKAG